MPEPISTTALLKKYGATAGAKLFLTLTKNITKKMKKNYSSWQNTQKISKLYLHLVSYRTVRTLWQMDKNVDLMSFFWVPTISYKGKDIKIEDVSDLKLGSNHLLIQGIAGQGKSMLMRYLCQRELIHCERIPVFIEMRKITKEYTISKLIYYTFQSFEIEIDDDLINDLSNSKQLLLLLDGFDEVAPELVQDVINEIEFLINTKPGINIIISSRPNSAILNSALFDVAKLNNLKEDEYKEVIYKLEDAANYCEISKLLIKKIDEKPNYRKLLLTPLMVTILIVTYKLSNELPEEISDFYNNLFTTLLSRHDGNKVGYVRPRKCDYDASKYKMIFGAFCLFSKNNKLIEYTEDEVQNYLNKTKSHLKSDFNNDDFLYDIISITNLIIIEGFNYRFIHKTIQEFFSAHYIFSLSTPLIEKFYEGLTANPNEIRKFSQELSFLYVMDQYRYIKLFVIKIFNKNNFVFNPNSKPLTIVNNFIKVISSNSFGLIGKSGKDNELRYNAMSLGLLGDYVGLSNPILDEIGVCQALMISLTQELWLKENNIEKIVDKNKLTYHFIDDVNSLLGCTFNSENESIVIEFSYYYNKYPDEFMHIHQRITKIFIKIITIINENEDCSKIEDLFN